MLIILIFLYLGSAVQNSDAWYEKLEQFDFMAKFVADDMEVVA